MELEIKFLYETTQVFAENVVIKFHEIITIWLTDSIENQKTRIKFEGRNILLFVK